MQGVQILGSFSHNLISLITKRVCRSSAGSWLGTRATPKTFSNQVALELAPEAKREDAEALAHRHRLRLIGEVPYLWIGQKTNNWCPKHDLFFESVAYAHTLTLLERGFFLFFDPRVRSRLAGLLVGRGTKIDRYLYTYYNFKIIRSPVVDLLTRY